MDFLVEKDAEGERLDRFLAQKNTAQYTRSYIEKIIREGLVLYNEKVAKASIKLKSGDRIHLTEKEAEPLDIRAEEIPLSSINGVYRPGIVHRIDKDTSGLLLVCKNDFSHKALAKQLQEHSITRRYHAICKGHFKEAEGTIDAPIGRDEKNRKQQAINRVHGKEAITHFRVLENLRDASLVECRLETGRTHQIRVHMKSIGHPLLGDPLYGPKKNPYAIQGQALHAMVLGFVHPRSGKYMEFQADYPEDFLKLLKGLSL